MKVDFKNLSSGEIIYKYNEKPENLYLIHSGKIKLLSKNGMEIAILESGEIFGETGHITTQFRSVTAKAETNSILKVIKKDFLNEKLNESDPVIKAIIRSLSIRIGEANSLAEKYWEELSIYKSIDKN